MKIILQKSKKLKNRVSSLETWPNFEKNIHLSSRHFFRETRSFFRFFFFSNVSATKNIASRFEAGTKEKYSENMRKLKNLVRKETMKKKMRD